MGMLVTGGAGFIGGHAVLAALDRGRRVVVLDDLSTGVRQALPPGVRLIEGSIRNEALVERVVREHAIGEILHFAALTQAPASLARPLSFYQVNAAWTCGLIAAAVRGGARAFVLSSTAAVYGEAAAAPIPESAPLSPCTPYGSSKAMAERMLQDAARATGLRYAVLRYFNVAGADPFGRARLSPRAAPHLIRIACEAATRDGALPVHGLDYPTADGSPVRDFVHVSELAEAHLLALDALRERTALTLNLGSGRGASVLQVAEAVRRASRAALPILPRPRRAGDLACAVADVSRASAELGWRPRLGVEDMVADTLAALQTRPGRPGRAPRRAGLRAEVVGTPATA